MYIIGAMKFIAVLLLSSLCFAKAPSHIAPMPPEISKAKSVFLYVETAHTQVHYDAAYKQLEKWGRWTLVDSADKADLVLLITTRDAGSFLFNTASATASGNSASAVGLTIPVSVSAHYLHVIDRSTGKALWSTSTGDTFLGSHEASNLIKAFRKRLEGK
jgi:hypothetical protein